MSIQRSIQSWCFAAVAMSALAMTSAQEADQQQPKNEAAKPPELPKIADEPKTIDPAALVAEKLAVKATQDFSNSSLREVVSWLREKHKLVVLIDETALADVGVSPAEPVSDQLTDDPLYLLLNRLHSMDLSWYFEDNVLYITTSDLASAHATTIPYQVSDLLDNGYKMQQLESVIVDTIDPENWVDVGGNGVLSSLGDVLFVRHNAARQRDVNAFLQALRKHGRQTFVNDPEQHLALRSKLSENITVEFADTPLESAIQELAEKTKIDIRLDLPALRSQRIREREPITLKLADRKLSTVLQAIVLDLKLTWVLRDGVLQITTPEEAEGFLKTAIYDVRDLCQDDAESEALIQAIISQTNPDSWDSVGGPGLVEMAKTGTLVVTHQERVHGELLNLLETYRTALRSSKPRKDEDTDPEKIVTTYYRVHSTVARDLSNMLPLLLPDKSWKTRQNPEGAGEIFVVASEPEVKTVSGKSGKEAADKSAVLIERSTLIVRQKRSMQDKIRVLLGRVEYGDTPVGKGGGMGGFGGGFFNVPPKRGSSKR